MQIFIVILVGAYTLLQFALVLMQDLLDTTTFTNTSQQLIYLELAILIIFLIEIVANAYAYGIKVLISIIYIASLQRSLAYSRSPHHSVECVLRPLGDQLLHYHIQECVLSDSDHFPIPANSAVGSEGSEFQEDPKREFD